jgi:hypothetical protein
MALLFMTFVDHRLRINCGGPFALFSSSDLERTWLWHSLSHPVLLRVPKRLLFFVSGRVSVPSGMWKHACFYFSHLLAASLIIVNNN